MGFLQDALPIFKKRELLFSGFNCASLNFRYLCKTLFQTIHYNYIFIRRGLGIYFNI